MGVPIMASRRFLPRLVPFFVLVLLVSASSTTLATNCSTLCSNAGYSNSHCDGTAPFCDGGCYDGSGDNQVQPYWLNGTGYIDCAGHCTDGNGCWSGHKECSCWDKIDCEQQCMYGAHRTYNGLWSTNWACAVRIDIDFGDCTECAAKIIGACDWSDDELGVDECYCFYAPPE